MKLSLLRMSNTADQTPQQLKKTLAEVEASCPDLLKDPAFQKMAAHELALRIHSDRDFFDPQNFKRNVDLFDFYVSKLGLQADSQFHKALESKIDNLLLENRKREDLPLKFLEIIAEKYIPEVRKRISEYRYKPPTGMGIDNLDILAAFLEKNPQLKDAKDQFQGALDKLTKNDIKDGTELVDKFGRKSGGKPLANNVRDMAPTILGPGVSRFILDVGHNDFRMVADVDFTQNPPKVHIVWVGTHKAYDYIDVNKLKVNYTK